MPFEFLSAQVPFEFRKPQVPKYLECLSAWVSCNCPSVSNARVSKCLWSTLGVPNFVLSALWVKSFRNITGNGLVNSLTEFFENFSGYIFYIKLIAFFFLVNKTCKSYYVFLTRCNHSKKFQKLSFIVL